MGCLSRRCSLPPSLVVAIAAGAVSTSCARDIVDDLEDATEDTTKDATPSGDPDAGTPRDGSSATHDGSAQDQRDGATQPDATTTQPDAATGQPDATTQPARALTFGEMVLPANTRIVNAIHGRGPTEVYAGTMSGDLLQYDGSSWTRVWHEPGNLGIRSLFATATRLYIAAETTLYVRDQAGTIVGTHSLSGVESMQRVYATSDADVYVTATRRTQGPVLAKLTSGSAGPTLSPIFQPSDISELHGMWSPRPGVLYVAGSQGSLYLHDSGVTTEEVIEYPNLWGTSEIALMTFYGVWGARDRVFAVGSRHLAFRRDADAVWRIAHAPYLSFELDAIDGAVDSTGEIEAYAPGRQASNGPLLRYYRDAWTPVNVPGDYHLFDVWSASADLYFIGGSTRSGFDGVILRGRR